MKMKNALAGAVIATLATVGSLAPAQTAVPEAQVGYALSSIGTKLDWWGRYSGYAEAVLPAVASAAYGLFGQAAGTALGGAVLGSAAGPIGMVAGAAIGAA